MDEQHLKDAKHYDTLLGHLDRLSNAPVGADSIANARCTMTEAQQAFKVLLCRTHAPLSWPRSRLLQCGRLGVSP